MPGGMSGILGEGSGTGALEGLTGGGLGITPPSDPTPTEPVLPLGF